MSVAEMLEAWEDKAWTKNYIRDVVRSLEQNKLRMRRVREAQRAAREAKKAAFPAG